MPASRTPANHPFVKLVKKTAKEIFGKAIVSVSSAGTGPMYYFDKVLGAPSVCVGIHINIAKLIHQMSLQI